MKLKRTDLDLRTASEEEVEAAMQKGVRAALRRHKEAGVPAVVYNHETGETVLLPPEEIPDYPEDAEDSEPRPEGH